MEKIRYYYIRDINNRPLVTVCLMKVGKAVARGVAYCSQKDNVCKKMGRSIAHQRASWAIEHKESNCAIGRNHIVSRNRFKKAFKAVYNPYLNKLEKKLLSPKLTNGGGVR